MKDIDSWIGGYGGGGADLMKLQAEFHAMRIRGMTLQAMLPKIDLLRPL